MSMWVNNPRSSSADLILTALKVTSDRGTAMGSVDHPIDWEPTPRLVQQVVNRQDVGLVSSSEQALVGGLLGGWKGGLFALFSTALAKFYSPQKNQ